VNHLNVKFTSKISTLAVKLAKEAYFGKALMRNCTVRGTREQPGLPAEKLTELKQFLISLFLKCHSMSLKPYGSNASILLARHASHFERNQYEE